VTDLAARVAEAICRKRAECCDNDLDDCVTSVRQEFDAGYPDLDSAEQDETAMLDCDAFDACAAAVASTSCDAWPFQGSVGIPADEPACYEILTPLLGDSDTCNYSYECADGYCRVEEGDSEGVCHDYASENEPCGEDTDPDQLCDAESMFCNESNRCQRRLGLGAACGDNAECESLVCDRDGGGTCIAPGEEQCEFTVATAPTNCSLSGAVGRRRGRGELYALVGLIVVGVRLRRRR
jgi:hypothetical protein